MSRNTHKSLQARLFAGEVPSLADGLLSIPCESLTAGETSLPSTTARTTLAASAVPTLSPEMISLITQTVRAAMAAENPPISEQVQALPSAVATTSAPPLPPARACGGGLTDTLALTLRSLKLLSLLSAFLLSGVHGSVLPSPGPVAHGLLATGCRFFQICLRTIIVKQSVLTLDCILILYSET